MTKRTYQNLIAGLMLIAVIALPGVMFHVFLSVAHIFFEVLELTLDELIEHMFHTSHHTAQVIAFYLLFFAALYGLYRLLKALPTLYCRLKTHVTEVWSDRRRHASEFWHSQRLTAKLKLTVIGILSTTGLLMLLLI